MAYDRDQQRRYRQDKAARLGVSQAALAATTRQRNREHVAAAKAGKPCVDCGGVFPSVCMDFDHLPGVEKWCAVTDLALRGASLARIDAEIAKCELICANCHRIRTAKRAGWNTNQSTETIDMTA